MYYPALSLPRMKIKDLDNEQFKKAFEEMQLSESLIAFYQLPDEQYCCLCTGLGEDELRILTHCLHRNTAFFQVVKLAILTIENLRKDDSDNDNFSLKTTVYNLKKMKPDCPTSHNTTCYVGLETGNSDISETCKGY